MLFIPGHAVSRFRERFPHLRRWSDPAIRGELERVYAASAAPEPTAVVGCEIRRGQLPGKLGIVLVIRTDDAYHPGHPVVVTVLTSSMVVSSQRGCPVPSDHESSDHAPYDSTAPATPGDD